MLCVCNLACMCVCVCVWKSQLGDCDLLVMTERRREGGREVRIDEAKAEGGRERGRAPSLSASFSLCDPASSHLLLLLLLSSSSASAAGEEGDRKSAGGEEKIATDWGATDGQKKIKNNNNARKGMRAVGGWRRAAFFSPSNTHTRRVCDGERLKRENTDWGKKWITDGAERWQRTATHGQRAEEEEEEVESKRDNLRCDCTNWWYPFYRGSNRNTESSSCHVFSTLIPFFFSFLLFDFFFIVFCVRGLVTKSRALFGIPRSESPRADVPPRHPPCAIYGLYP